MPYKTDVFETVKIRYRNENYDAKAFECFLNLRISSWPKKFKVWSLKRLSDNKIFSMYDMTQYGRIIEFNTGNAHDLAYVYFEDCPPVTIDKL